MESSQSCSNDFSHLFTIYLLLTCLDKGLYNQLSSLAMTFCNGCRTQRTSNHTHMVTTSGNLDQLTYHASLWTAFGNQSTQRKSGDLQGKQTQWSKVQEECWIESTKQYNSSSIDGQRKANDVVNMSKCKGLQIEDCISHYIFHHSSHLGSKRISYHLK